MEGIIGSPKNREALIEKTSPYEHLANFYGYTQIYTWLISFKFHVQKTSCINTPQQIGIAKQIIKHEDMHFFRSNHMILLILRRLLHIVIMHIIIFNDLFAFIIALCS